MWRTNLKILLTVIGTLAAYTGVANMIPQLESSVPEAVEVGADVTPEELVSIGQELFEGAGGCTACHGLGTRAPDLLGVAGTVCETRRPDLGCKEYLHESLVDPAAYVVEGFNPIMPAMSRTLSPRQIWALVAFLESQGGTVDVSAADLSSAEPAAAAGAPTGGAAAAGDVGGGVQDAASGDPRALIQSLGCVACHRLDGEGGEVGPPFEDLAGREPEFIRRSILLPNADTAEGYEAFVGTMPPNFGERMTAAQLEALVQFLAGGR
ncbi:MAG: c-type cytochrome [Gemmatimonadota bacterium]